MWREVHGQCWRPGYIYDMNTSKPIKRWLCVATTGKGKIHYLTRRDGEWARPQDSTLPPQSTWMEHDPDDEDKLAFAKALMSMQS